MSSFSEIRQLLADITEEKGNQAGTMYINALKNEFITLQRQIEIPRISVHGVSHAQALFVLRQLYEEIPEFLYKHQFLPVPKPHSDIFSLHFVVPLKGVFTDFVHLFKIDLQFGGDTSTVTEKGTTEFFPGFITDRIYYKSYLIPVLSLKERHDKIADFEPAKLMVKEHIESEVGFYVSVLFDDLPVAQIVSAMLQFFEKDLFPFSPNIYSFLDYNFLTACFKVVYPSFAEIEKALEIFEPVLFVIASHFKGDISLQHNGHFFEKELVVNGDFINLSREFASRIRKYFSRYSLYSDDDLALKRWRRLDVRH